jgi:ferric-dicitrate binding protein FerR (iron transport regulator)
MNDFDARMRRLFADAGTSPGFDARVLARVAALDTRPAASQRAEAERRRELERRRLRRETWANGAIVAGIGAAGVTLVLHHGAEVSKWVERIAAAASDPSLSMGFVLAVLVAGAWPFLRSFLPR